MNQVPHRDFDKAALTWDEKPERLQLAAAVAAGIAAVVPLHGDLRALEYGCGTGLVGLLLAARVGHLTAVDTSPGMLDELRKKCRDAGVENVTPVLLAPGRTDLPEGGFDLLFASMLLHHVAELEVLLDTFRRLLSPNGYLALADLDREDGTFHDDPAGIAHHGFARESIASAVTRAGFSKPRIRTVHTLCKEREGGVQEYPVFLLTARKPG